MNYQFRKILVNPSKLNEIKTISISQDYHNANTTVIMVIVTGK